MTREPERCTENIDGKECRGEIVTSVLSDRGKQCRRCGWTGEGDLPAIQLPPVRNEAAEALRRIETKLDHLLRHLGAGGAE